MYIAINELDKTVVSYHVGVRSEFDTKRFLNKMFKNCPKITKVHSDGYRPYKKALMKKDVKHTTQKCFTTHIESLNSILRHNLSAFNRRSRNISKSKQNLKLILNLFFYRYNLKKQL